MPEKDPNTSDLQEGPGPLERKAVSRREFLKIAGIAGATIGVGAGLGGLVAACGGSTTTTTAATTATTAGGATTTTAAAQSTTTVSSAPTTGRELKFGFMTPKTGNDAAFATADAWAASRWQEYAKAGSLVDAEGVAHPMSIVIKDTQSDVNFGGTVAAGLINNDKVDILMAASTTDTTIPAALQAEALGCPCVLTDSPSDSLIHGVGGTDTQQFKWWYMAFWDNKGLVDCSVAMLTDPALPTNKMVGCLWPNDVEGNDRRNFYPPPMKAAGLTVVDGGNFSVGLEDWTTIIALFKKQGCEDAHRPHDPAGLGQLLEAVLPAELGAQGGRYRYPDPLPDHPGSPGHHRLRPGRYQLVASPQPVQVLPHRRDLRRPVPELREDDRPAVDAAHGALHALRVGRRCPQAHHERGRQGRDHHERGRHQDGYHRGTARLHLPGLYRGHDVGKRSFPNIVFTPLWMGQWVKGTVQNPWSIKVWPYDLLIVEPTDAGGFLHRSSQAGRPAGDDLQVNVGCVPMHGFGKPRQMPGLSPFGDFADWRGSRRPGTRG